MDLTTLGPILLAALGALGIIGQYLNSRSRRDRSELRKARRWIQEADVWMYTLEREGWTSRGRIPPKRPEMLEIRHDADDEAPTALPPRSESHPGGSSRHALRDR